MQNSILITGVVLLVLGVIGLVFGFYPFWMWGLVVLGIIGIIWGWLSNSRNMTN